MTKAREQKKNENDTDRSVNNGANCVKVFKYQDVFLRPIGCEGMTNDPIGVGIKPAREMLVADNDNNFNVTVFTQDGQLIKALESKVKHGQCFHVAVMDEGCIVLASKDYRQLYFYKTIWSQKERNQNKWKANHTKKTQNSTKTRKIPADNKGRVIIVECKLMCVITSDNMRKLLNKLGCSKQLEFANRVVVNDKEEIFMSDNRAHYVKVLNYQGLSVHPIAGEGMTKWPNWCWHEASWRDVTCRQGQQFQRDCLQSRWSTDQHTGKQGKTWPMFSCGTDGGGMYCTCE